MKRVYQVTRTGQYRDQRRVVQTETARTRYADSMKFRNLCKASMKALEGDQDVTS